MLLEQVHLYLAMRVLFCILCRHDVQSLTESCPEASSSWQTSAHLLLWFDMLDSIDQIQTAEVSLRSLLTVISYLFKVNWSFDLRYIVVDELFERFEINRLPHWSCHVLWLSNIASQSLSSNVFPTLQSLTIRAQCQSSACDNQGTQPWKIG